MRRIRLPDDWSLCGSDPQSCAPSTAAAPGERSAEWMPVDVPGDVNSALLARGLIPDPHFDVQARQCYWVTAKEWWYRIEFDLEHTAFDDVDLCLEGVDGHADIWLNGVYLGLAENAFRPFRRHVGRALKDKANRMLVRFRALDQVLGGPRLDELAGWEGRRAFIRKPQFSFGWDWALPLPSQGLSGPVWLELDSGLALVDCAVRPFRDGRVDMAFEAGHAARRRGYRIEVSLRGHGAELSHKILGQSPRPYTGHGTDGDSATQAPCRTTGALTIPDPALWFPAGYGNQPLYDYAVRLIVDDACVDTRAGRIGVRECATRERPFRPSSGSGYSFEIEVNGTATFCKGANWVPLELWPATASDEQYRFYLHKAREANFNMLRVWGGGVYEKSVFYELCDELGIMVWQDFMFASTGYPVDRLRDEIVCEAEHQVRRLRNHPCIVLWCGCNEDVFSWQRPEDHDARSEQEDSGVYSEASESADTWHVDRVKDDPQIYSMILRGTVGRLGHGVPYVESSPHSRHDAGNTPSSGNCHISCWKYALLQSGRPEEFRKHFEQVCSFNSEFCIQGPCSEDTLRSFLAPANHWPPNEHWTYHIQRGHRNIPHHEQTLLIAGGLFGEIRSLQDYVKHGQAAHAEMMRAEFESARRDRPDSGGTMVWMYNDCWPTSNWSIIDYYRNPKPAFYAAKRACAPLLPIIFERGGEIQLFLGNDTLRDVAVEAEYGRETLHGEQTWSARSAPNVTANSTLKFASVPTEQQKAARDEFFYLDASCDGEPLTRVVYFPGMWKDVDWPHPKIELSIQSHERHADRYCTQVSVRTDTFARLCHLLWRGTPARAWFSDNYFDLSAGSTRCLTVEADRELQQDDLQTGHWWTRWQ